MSNLTREEAITKNNSKWWLNKSAKEIVDFQLYEDRLCMPFDEFHKAMEFALNRPVFTHEFADAKTLKEEYEGKRKYDGIIPSIKRVAGDKPILIMNSETGLVAEANEN